MSKSPDAFRTISEVADWLGVQAHVLRFWESKFSQVKPIKRAGGRRYYRPADMAVIGGIKRLLHDDGLTIKGVQKILREQGVSHVADLSQPLDDLTLAEIDNEAASPSVVPFPPASKPEPEDVELEPIEETPRAVEPEIEPAVAKADAAPEPPKDVAPAEDPAPAVAADPDADDAIAMTPEADDGNAAQAEPEGGPADAPSEAPAPMPAFSHRAAPREPTPTPEAEPEPTPRARNIEVPDVPADDQIDAAPGLLAKLAALHALSSTQAAEIPAMLDKLQALRDRMARPAKD